MLNQAKNTLARLLIKLEPYAKTDLIYFTKSAFWLNLNSIFGAAISLLISVLFAHYVAKDIYGIYKYIISIAGIATGFSLTGMNTAVLSSIAQGFGGTFKRSLFVQAKWIWPQIIFLLATAFYYFWNGNIFYGWTFVIISIFGPISTIANTYLAVLNGKKDFRTTSVYGIFSNVVYMATMCAVIFGAPKSFILMVAAYYVTGAVSNIFFSIRTYRKYQGFLSTTPANESDIGYAKHLSLMNIFGTVATQAENIIVYHLLGPVALALFSFSIIIPERIRTLFGFIASAAAPKILEKDIEEIKPNLTRKTWQLIGIALVISILYIIAAPYIFKVLFPEYQNVVLYSQIFSLSLIAIASNIPLTTLLAHRKKTELYYINFGLPLIKIATTAIAIWLYGIWGAIISKILYNLITLSSSAYYLHRKKNS